jgi:hypothetical protein
MSGVMLAFAAFWLVAMRGALADFIRRHLSRLAAGALGLAVLGAFATKFDHMLESAQEWARNLTELPEWGFAWFFIVALLGAGVALPVPRFRQAFSHATVAMLVTTLLLALGRIPYRFSVNDSANRMTMHVLPLIFFYIGLKLLLAIRSERTAAPHAPEPNAVSE